MAKTVPIRKLALIHSSTGAILSSFGANYNQLTSTPMPRDYRLESLNIEYLEDEADGNLTEHNDTSEQPIVNVSL